jgi:hypothetical protein
MAADQQTKLEHVRMNGIFDLCGYIGNLRLANMAGSDKAIE